MKIVRGRGRGRDSEDEICKHSRDKKMKMMMLEEEEEEYKRFMRRDKKKMLEEEEYILEDKRLKQGIPKLDIYILLGERWYAIKSADFTDGGVRKKRLEPALPELAGGCIRGCRYAALGTKIFASGGFDVSAFYEERKKDIYKDIRMRRQLISPDPVLSNKVFYIDILDQDDCWKAAPPMNTIRVRPYMVADAGKMYVFGGLLIRHAHEPIDENRIFAEVYDPLNPDAGWKNLAFISDEELKLPQAIDGHAFVGDDDRKILFHSHCDKTLHYLSTTRQETGDYDENFGACHTYSAFLDGFLFFFGRGGMHAYDVLARSGKELNVFLHGVIKDTLPHREFGESKPICRLQSLGTCHLALVWANSPEYDEFLDVHCSIFKMSKKDDFIVGDVVSYSSYSVKSGQFMSCMAVPSLEENVCVDEECDKNIKRSDKQHQRKRERDEFNYDTKERIREEKSIQEPRRTEEQRRRNYQRSQECW